MACCKYGDIYTTHECRAVVYYSSREHHVCVKPSFKDPASLPEPIGKSPDKLPSECPEGHSPGPMGCELDDGPRLQTFYVYRALKEEENLTSNFDAMSMSGILYHLQTAVLGCPRTGEITRIKRLKVTMKNTPEAYRTFKTQFAPLLAYRNQQCISPSCEQSFQSRGYAVGCLVQERGQPCYLKEDCSSDSLHYSFPGPCPLSAAGAKTEECLAQYPGGLCDEPTGTDNCTFHVEDAGTVTLDELSGRNASQSLQDWCAAGNLEWDPATDRGVGMNFWNGLHNDPLRKERMYKLGYLFWKKYPSFPKRLSDPRGCRYAAQKSGPLLTQ